MRYWVYYYKSEGNISIAAHWKCRHCGAEQISFNNIYYLVRKDQSVFSDSRKAVARETDRVMRKIDTAVKANNLRKLRIKTVCGNCRRKPAWARYIFPRGANLSNGIWILASIIFALIFLTIGAYQINGKGLLALLMTFSVLIFQILYNSIVDSVVRNTPQENKPQVNLTENENLIVRRKSIETRHGILLKDFEEDIMAFNRIFYRKDD